MPVARVSASYGAKKPSDPSNTFAGSQESHVSYAVEFDTTGMTDEQIKKRLYDEFHQLDNGVKLAVAASLDVGFVEDNGMIRLTPVTVPTVPHNAAAQSRPQSAARPPQQGGGGYPRGGGAHGGGSQYRPPKVDPSTLPVLMIDYFKTDWQNPVAFYDQRGPKAQGVYSPKAADFKSVDRFTGQDGKANNIPIWLVAADGAANTWEQHLVAEAEQRANEKAPY